MINDKSKTIDDIDYFMSTGQLYKAKYLIRRIRDDCINDEEAVRILNSNASW